MGINLLNLQYLRKKISQVFEVLKKGFLQILEIGINKFGKYFEKLFKVGTVGHEFTNFFHAAKVDGFLSQIKRFL
ncbi:hypothetical protein B0A80_09515 [Flavobacterium tructae]|nr:hypothetical protein B0A80_09515 [Flavobacterium tructae]